MRKHPNKQLMGYLSDRGLRSTGQRDIILALFIEAGRHVSADELYAVVKKTHPSIGFATVYRTLKLLSDAGLAEEQRFEDGFTRFAYKSSDAHHDHLICTACGAIVEFENARIESLQQEVARKNKFTVESHKLEIYGVCASCSKIRTKSKKL